MSEEEVEQNNISCQRDTIIADMSRTIYHYISTYPVDSERFGFIQNVVRHAYNRFLQGIEDKKIASEVNRRVAKIVEEEHEETVDRLLEERWETRMSRMKNVSVYDMVNSYLFGEYNDDDIY